MISVVVAVAQSTTTTTGRKRGGATAAPVRRRSILALMRRLVLRAVAGGMEWRQRRQWREGAVAIPAQPRPPIERLRPGEEEEEEGGGFDIGHCPQVQ